MMFILSLPFIIMRASFFHIDMQEHTSKVFTSGSTNSCIFNVYAGILFRYVFPMNPIIPTCIPFCKFFHVFVSFQDEHFSQTHCALIFVTIRPIIPSASNHCNQSSLHESRSPGGLYPFLIWGAGNFFHRTFV